MSPAPEAPRPPPWLAPWTARQVAALAHWQTAPGAHPYTCPTGHPAARELIPTGSGWVCGGCDYTQNWAWAVGW